MKSDYRIEEVLNQSGQQIVYRVSNASGQSFALTRIIFGEAELGGLEDGVFEKALAAAKQLDHPCLRKVLDGGVDEVDHAPWIVTQWWDAKSAKQRHQDGEFLYEDKVRLEGQARNLMEGLGGFAASLKFDPSQVVGIQAQDGTGVETFGLDLREWFAVYSRTGDAHFDRNPELGFARMMGALPVSAPIVSAAQAPSALPQALVVSSGSGLSAGWIVMMIFLAGAIGGGTWWATQKKNAKPPIAEVKTERVEVIEKKSLVSVPLAEPPVARNSFKVSDEEKIKTMKGETISLTGRLLNYESNSNYLYLHFKKFRKGSKRVLAVKIPKKILTASRDAGFFKKVIGERILATGEVARSGGGRGWYVFLKDVDDLLVLDQQKPAPQIPKAILKPKERPPAGEIVDVAASDSAAMKKNVGKWVALTGRVVRISRTGWIFEAETEDGGIISGKLGEGNLSDAVGFTITAIGQLTSESEIVVATKDDIEIDEEGGSFEFKEFYTIKDDQGIRSLEGERLTLEASVLRVEKSGSGSTFYLVFTEERPYLAAAIGSDDEKYGVTYKYLESLVGKKIRVTGNASAERGGRRFILRMGGKDDIEE